MMNITVIMPAMVTTSTTMPSMAEVTKSWMASISLVTRLIRSPVRASSCWESESLWMW